MKRFFAKFLILFGFSASLFAYDWFAPRYFEMVVDMPFGMSNNAIGVGDVFKKDLVIDFKEIAGRLPDSGMEINANMNPSLAFNLNLRKVRVGVKFGLEGSGFASISKDVFEFIADGNQLGERINCNPDLIGDIFAYNEVSVGMNIKGFEVEIIPAFFMPVAHVKGRDSTVYFENGDDGSLVARASIKYDLYSAYDESKLTAGMGFDLGGAVGYQLFDFLNLRGKFRIPIVPGHLDAKKTTETVMSLDASFQDLLDGNSGEKNNETTNSDWITESYYINRPLKLNAYADFTPFGKWFTVTGGLGLGFRHPFTSDIDSFKGYGEYYLAATLALRNILGITASTEYTDMIFKHQLAFMANVRIFELDFGVNTQSSGFIGSCIAAGAGGFITVKIGY